MPLPTEDLLEQRQMTRLQFELQPARSAIISLLIVSNADELPGLPGWVYQTSQAMSAEERFRNRLVALGLHYAAMPQESWPSLPAYINHLRKIEPERLVKKLMNTYAAQPVIDENGIPQPGVEGMSVEQALQSADNYLAFLRQRFKPSSIEEELEREAYRYAVEPEKMRTLIAGHLQHMWDAHLAQEWERVRPLLEDSARAFRQVDFSGKSLAEAVVAVTDNEGMCEKWESSLKSVSNIIFVPNMHVGPYVHKQIVGKTYLIFYGARLPKGTQVHAPELSRAELVVRLGALADDIRLQILQYIAGRGELRSTEIISALGLSQSAASRHLMQLSATGYLNERRCDGAKCYSINRDRIDDTFEGLLALLYGE